MLAVDDYGSFTRVGAELGYTQSGITQTMKNLEKKAGFPLYIKDHHGIKLTNEAKSLIPAIRALLNADEVIHQEIAALNGAQKGTIRIGTYLSCSIHWFLRLSVNSSKHTPILSYRLSRVWKANWPTGSRNVVLISALSAFKRIIATSFFLSWMTRCMLLFPKMIPSPKKSSFPSRRSRVLLS